MLIRSPRELGLLLRQNRRDRGWSQQQLAYRIGASRHWVMGVERGKPTAEIGLVLKTISALGLTCDMQKRGAAGTRPGGFDASTPVDDPRAAVDLNGVLAAARGGRLSIR